MSSTALACLKHRFLKGPVKLKTCGPICCKEGELPQTQCAVGIFTGFLSKSCCLHTHPDAINCKDINTVSAAIFILARN